MIVHICDECRAERSGTDCERPVGWIEVLKRRWALKSTPVNAVFCSLDCASAWCARAAQLERKVYDPIVEPTAKIARRAIREMRRDPRASDFAASYEVDKTEVPSCEKIGCICFAKEGGAL